MHAVLALDIAGNPISWISAADAALYYTSGKVIWDLGEHEQILRGGHNYQGIQSTVNIRPVIAVNQHSRGMKHLRKTLPLGDSNNLLFSRDRYICAYCGEKFPWEKLSRDHILASSKGGLDVWTNCVTSCRDCNQAKGNKFVHDFKPLLYVPYEPCRFEHFILSGRNVIADQHDYLSARLPLHSRALN